MRSVKPLVQTVGNGPLGHGPGTIKESGCLLTCLTMAVNSYRPDEQPFTLEAMNYKLDKLGLFDDKSRFNVAEAFRTFGITIDRGPLIPMVVDRALENKQLVVIGVDYKEGQSSRVSKADHFILFFATDMQGSYLAVNPGDGQIMRFDKVTISRQVGRRIWRACEMIVLMEPKPKGPLV